MMEYSCVLIEFLDSNSIQNALAKSHFLDDQSLEVKPYFQCFGITLPGFDITLPPLPKTKCIQMYNAGLALLDDEWLMAYFGNLGRDGGYKVTDIKRLEGNTSALIEFDCEYDVECVLKQYDGDDELKVKRYFPTRFN